MQTTHVLRGNAQNQPCPRMLWPYLHRHHPLLRSHGYSRKYARRATTGHATRSIALLNATHQPRQQRHGTHKEHHNQQRLRHAAAIHGSPGAGVRTASPHQ